MKKAEFSGGMNIAIKIPGDRFYQTVKFYRDVLGFKLEKEEGQAVAASYSMAFGPVTLWLDSVPDSDQSDIWLEVLTDDLKAAEKHVREKGVVFQDDLEVFPEGMEAHWIKSPAGTVHLLRGQS
ncbi:MAG TPA: VOC family protein [Nitrospiria bacterium]